MKDNLLLTVFLFFTGCSTTHVTFEDAESVPREYVYSYQEMISTRNASLVIIRDSGIIGSACRLGLYINGEIAADIGASERITFYVTPGEFLLGTGTPKNSRGLCAMNIPLNERETFLKKGQLKRFRMFTDQNGNRDILPVSTNK